MMIIVVAEKGFAFAQHSELCVFIEISLELEKLFVFNHQIEQGLCPVVVYLYLFRQCWFQRFYDWFRNMSWGGGGKASWKWMKLDCLERGIRRRWNLITKLLHKDWVLKFLIDFQLWIACRLAEKKMTTTSHAELSQRKTFSLSPVSRSFETQNSRVQNVLVCNLFKTYSGIININERETTKEFILEHNYVKKFVCTIIYQVLST